MLRLCRSDNMGVRDMVPALMLRLHKDQDCYYFINWWVLSTRNPWYDWGISPTSCPDSRRADVFEGVGGFLNKCGDISHTSCLTLLKIKLLLDLMRLEQSSSSLASRFPPAILHQIQSSVPQNPVVCANRSIMDGEAGTRPTMIRRLKKQIDTLYQDVHGANSDFWTAIVNPPNRARKFPTVYGNGSAEEIQLMIHFNYAAWVETPGAIDFIKAKVHGGN
ncbi:hypothetical protein PEX1_011870 [Penicillium expansum]|uniref:Uncharacterized protein n=1 Tax=Penicillium expansum TaxID=27334 RepID=A0A0A2IB43_PENEN|nr:hypothetical protein PEX2_046630 [Penicillium expansum]KGO37356.1 hypothetical protein PEX1_011870 [Penicillium expansum]KGO39638.1 hypothetical protein PEXP_048140 [Penicillium expansum]KGO62637.1 hypothetical protein PEX2_046630 [Penicillium expansum]